MTVKPGEAPPHGETDWARANAMTDEEALAAALSDPDAQPLDPEALAKMRRISPVKALRQRLGMTQVEFAEAEAETWAPVFCQPEGAVNSRWMRIY
jgi:putative transcriptional regulator